MRLVKDCVAERLAEWNRRSGGSRFRGFVASSATGDWDEDTWADVIRADVQQRVMLNLPVGLREYLAVPEIAGSMVLVDTAIRAIVHAKIAKGTARAVAMAEIRAECPEWEEAITTAEVLSSLLGSDIDADPAPTEKLPRRLGSPSEDGQPRYQLIHRIGAGSHASVYRAIDHELGTSERPAWVAVKLLRGERGSHVPLRKLLAEAERARHVAHPGVIPIYDAGCTPHGEVFIVTPVFEGRTFADAFQNVDSKKITAAVAAVRDVCEALQAVHNAGMLHCDIKPLNLLMDSDGRVKIADFGMSVWAEHGDDGGAGRGTLGFMAPEQRSRAGEWRRPTVDTYATGATLAWALTGQVLHGSTAADAERALSNPDLHAATVEAKLASIEDPELRRIVARAVDFDPRKRYQTPEAMASDLRAWQAGEPIEWMGLGLKRRFSMWARRSPQQAAALAAVIGAAGMVVGAIVWQQAQSHQMDLKMVMEREQAGQKTLDNVRTLLATTTKTLTIARDSRWRDSSTPVFTLMEAMSGPTFFDESGYRRGIWDRRIEEARQNQAASPEGSVEHLNWTLLEGIWLLQDEKFAEALEVMDRAVAGWTARCEPEDPWLAEVKGVRAAAKILTVSRGRLDAKPGEPKPDIPAEELAELEGLLRRIENDPRPTRRIYYLATRALLALEDDSWRNNPARTQEILADNARRRAPLAKD
ncbi:MAG: serine/threonine protein kinase [Tepidisphaera sp.]